MVTRCVPISSSIFWMNIIRGTRLYGNLKRQWIGDATPSYLSMRRVSADCLSPLTVRHIDLYSRWSRACHGVQAKCRIVGGSVLHFAVTDVGSGISAECCACVF